MDVKTDALIIGGGPAGSYLTRYLVKNGFNGDVMLIDKKHVIYAPVICGELLPTEDLLRPWINGGAPRRITNNIKGISTQGIHCK
ncbi:FAD-dependent monooxygenase [Vulcanisaeta souniana]|uniref:NAD(P)-binding protein n=1 Tax=Vulcanisaeta souniana TaxID=164452 RepID=UPI0006D1F58E|nr:NAD(P)-binding protein [Vulcanisaeta souniana]